MVEAVAGLPWVVQVLLATAFTWGMTALEATLVLFTKEVKRWVLDAMLGFAGGVMIAASYQQIEIALASLKRVFGLGRMLAKTLVGLATRIAAYTYAFFINWMLIRPQDRIKELWA